MLVFEIQSVAGRFPAAIKNLQDFQFVVMNSARNCIRAVLDQQLSRICSVCWHTRVWVIGEMINRIANAFGHLSGRCGIVLGDMGINGDQGSDRKSRSCDLHGRFLNVSGLGGAVYFRFPSCSTIWKPLREKPFRLCPLLQQLHQLRQFAIRGAQLYSPSASDAR